MREVQRGVGCRPSLQVFARGQDGSEQGRGLTPGFLEGSFHQRLVRGRSPRHRGNFIGRVQQVEAGEGVQGDVVNSCCWRPIPAACQPQAAT